MSKETRILLTDNNSSSFTNLNSNFEKNIPNQDLKEKNDSVSSTTKRKASDDKIEAKNRPENPPKSSNIPVQKDSKSSKTSRGTQQSNKITNYFDI